MIESYEDVIPCDGTSRFVLGDYLFVGKGNCPVGNLSPKFSERRKEFILLLFVWILFYKIVMKLK